MTGVAPPSFVLGIKRLRLDAVDALSRRLLRIRQHQVQSIARWKRAYQLPLHDPDREEVLLSRARRDAETLGMHPQWAVELQQFSLRACCESKAPSAAIVAEHEPMTDAIHQSANRHLLRLLPPPQRMAPLLRAFPLGLLSRLCEALHRHALANLLADGCLAEIKGRQLAIDVSDLGLRWVWRLSAHRIDLLSDDAVAECTIRGTACDLLLLASRLEDADTLFFQRKLQLTGDVELGLTARNLLDRLPWERIPLSARVLLLKVATLARAAREARRGTAASPAAKGAAV